MTDSRKRYIICATCGYPAQDQQDFDEHEIEMAKTEPPNVHHVPR